MNLNNQVEKKEEKQIVIETEENRKLEDSSENIADNSEIEQKNEPENQEKTPVTEDITTQKDNQEDETGEKTHPAEKPSKPQSDNSEESDVSPEENLQPDKEEIVEYNENQNSSSEKESDNVSQTEADNDSESSKKDNEKEKELAQYIETFKNYKQGDIIEGIIVSISDSEVLVDISYKSEGSIPINEFTGSEPPKKNDRIKVYYERSENAEGKVLLSKKKADFHLAFDKLNEIYKNNEKINGVIKKRVRGGMITDVMGIDAFLPGSQISTKPVPNLDHFIGRDMTYKIINLDKEKKNIIVSRRKVMEEERNEKIDKLLEKIHVGAELDGEVKNITDYGAFIDLGGLDGLLHITDMTWGQITHPSEMLNISDKVKVKVIDYNPEEERISLGLKQLVPHPWENIEAKYDEGSKVRVKVASLAPYGAFVELEPGVEGLVHISEMSWTRKITNPRQALLVGETIDAIVLYVSKEERKISLGIKQMEPNPWLTIDERYPEGTIIKGRIKSLTPFGVFIELERDIDGLVHISDISWTKRISHPKEVFNKGDEIEAIILSIDKHLHRIAMGIKQLTPDPWQNLEEILPVNTEITGTISSIIPKGVLVQVQLNDQTIEGFVPISHLAIPRLEKPELSFRVGDEIPMKVIELDMENRRLIFSVKAYLFSKDRDTLQKFLAKYDPINRRSGVKEKKQTKIIDEIPENQASSENSEEKDQEINTIEDSQDHERFDRDNEKLKNDPNSDQESQEDDKNDPTPTEEKETPADTDLTENIAAQDVDQKDNREQVTSVDGEKEDIQPDDTEDNNNETTDTETPLEEEKKEEAVQ